MELVFIFLYASVEEGSWSGGLEIRGLDYIINHFLIKHKHFSNQSSTSTATCDALL